MMRYRDIYDDAITYIQMIVAVTHVRLVGRNNVPEVAGAYHYLFFPVVYLRATT